MWMNQISQSSVDCGEFYYWNCSILFCRYCIRIISTHFPAITACFLPLSVSRYFEVCRSLNSGVQSVWSPFLLRDWARLPSLSPCRTRTKSIGMFSYIFRLLFLYCFLFVRKIQVNWTSVLYLWREYTENFLLQRVIFNKT